MIVVRNGKRYEMPDPRPPEASPAASPVETPELPANYNDLKKMAARLGISAVGNAAELRARIVGAL